VLASREVRHKLPVSGQIEAFEYLERFQLTPLFNHMFIDLRIAFDKRLSWLPIKEVKGSEIFMRRSHVFL
jgi:hypothetical protein